MTKLLVVNSCGPMASTLLAGLAEKLGFTNIPLRKLGLHQYLMGETALDSGHMQRRVRESIIAHSKPAQFGGVSVLDRDSQPPRALTALERVAKELAAFEQRTFTDLQDLYSAGRQIYCRAVTYKTVTTDPGWHIELTVDTHRFDPVQLYDRYTAAFDEVYMVHLHRDFGGWINSLASQAFRHPDWKQRLRFFPHLKHREYALYEKAVEKMPGLHLPFDDLFDRPIEDIARQLAALTGAPLPPVDWRAESYDMYGKIIPYQTAFTRFDDKIDFLPPRTRAWLAETAKDGRLDRVPANIAAWLRYLDALRRFRTRSSP